MITTNKNKNKYLKLYWILKYEQFCSNFKFFVYLIFILRPIKIMWTINKIYDIDGEILSN